MADLDFSALVQKFVNAVNEGDTEEFLTFFQNNGSVLDSGRRYSGFDSIKQWSDHEFIGAEGNIKVKKLNSPQGNSMKVEADWKSTFYSGPSVFEFIFTSDGKILELRIQG